MANTKIDLPKLPAKNLLHVVMPDDYRYGDVYGYDRASMQAYGAACANAALEAAAKCADQHARRNFPWASENSDIYHAQANWAELIAKAIRAMKEPT